jgi:hypothetical protein
LFDMMSHRLRPLMLLVLAVMALAVTACGGGDEEKATSSTDVNQLLRDTFSGKNKVDSGKLNLVMKIDSAAAGGATGPVSVKVAGPFESQGTGKLPKFKIDASLSGAGQNLTAGATSTGEKGFLSFRGQDYAVSDEIFKQFKASYEEAQKKNGGNSAQSLATLGIDPHKWLQNPKNAGETKVGDEDTIKITGDVNVNALLDDLNKALGKARSLGLQGSENLPSQLTPEQRKQFADSVKNLKVEIYTGKKDTILRRMLIKLGLRQASDQSKTANVDFDLSLLDVNEGQSIKAPSNPKPFDELVGQLQGLAGQLGGSASGGSSSSGSGSSGSGANADDFEKYSKCVTKAGNDTAKAQKCADILK